MPIHITIMFVELFLRSGTYLEYTQKYLSPDQIDAVDIAQYLKP